MSWLKGERLWKCRLCIFFAIDAFSKEGKIKYSNQYVSICSDLIFSCLKHIYRTLWGCRRYKFSACYALKRFQHLQKASHSCHSAPILKTPPEVIYIFCLTALSGCGIGCMRKAGFRPIALCKSSEKSCRIPANWSFLHAVTLRIGCKKLQGSFLSLRSMFTACFWSVWYQLDSLLEPLKFIWFQCFLALCKMDFLSDTFWENSIFSFFQDKTFCRLKSLTHPNLPLNIPVLYFCRQSLIRYWLVRCGTQFFILCSCCAKPQKFKIQAKRFFSILQTFWYRFFALIFKVHSGYFKFIS